MVNKVKVPMLRDLFVRFVGIKLELQFSGWLQYLMPLPTTLVLLLLAGVVYLFGAVQAAGYIAIPGAILLFLMLFDIVTVKFRIRPPEPLPGRRGDLDVFSRIRARVSCRSYQNRELTRGDYAGIMLSIKRHCDEKKFSQSSVRFEYIAAPLTVWPVVNAQEFLVAIAPKE